MKNATAIVCSFSSLDDLPRTMHGNRRAVLRALHQVRRISIFEITSAPKLARTMDYLGKHKLYRTVGGEYPWIEVEVTPEGHAFLEAGK